MITKPIGEMSEGELRKFLLLDPKQRPKAVRDEDKERFGNMEFPGVPSGVIGVLDAHGVLRVLITHLPLQYHQIPGEVMIPVPDFQVREPVPWFANPYVVAVVQKYMDHWVRTLNDPDQPQPIRKYLETVRLGPNHTDS